MSGSEAPETRAAARSPRGGPGNVGINPTPRFFWCLPLRLWSIGSLRQSSPMSLLGLPREETPVTEGRIYEVQSELLRASLPRHQKNPEIFLTWLNTVCAVFLGVGVFGVRNPDLFTFRPAAADEAPLVFDSKLDNEPDRPKAAEATPDESLPVTVSDQLPVVVPVPVLDIREVTFARAVEGVVTVDLKKLGTFDHPKPNIGVAGPEPKAGNPDAITKPVATAGSGGGGKGGGRRRLTAEDVDYGPDLPQPKVSKHGRVEIAPDTRIWVTFGENGSITEVRVDPPFSHAGYEREVRDHIRKYWHSKIGATAGWAPVKN